MRAFAAVLVMSTLLFACAACGAAGGGSRPGESSQQASGTAEPGAPQPAGVRNETAGAVQKIPLRVFCAGSLILPFAELESAYESAYPEVDVLNECHGSIQVIRHVTELHEKIDVVATADQALIPLLMYGAADPETGRPYADWNIRFAGNRLSLAYTPESRSADEITPENWFEILTRPGVKVGIADPRLDASGYRALMALKLAEGHYGKKGILNGLVREQFTLPIAVFEEDDLTEISVPEILEPRDDARLMIRGASIQLIALLESGDLDYAFEYESVIRQHRLNWVALPDAVNLSAESYREAYRQVQVKLDFQRFASVKPIFYGEPIGYGITIPSNAAQPAQAARFIAFLLSAQGRAVMAANYQPLFDPLQCDRPENIPDGLGDFCTDRGGQP